MKKFALLLSAVTLGLTACVNTEETDPYRHIKVVDSSEVTGCKLIGNLSTNAMAPYGMFKGTANDTVIELARKQGFKMGATHLVLNAPGKDGDYVTMTGRAYVCAP